MHPMIGWGFREFSGNASNLEAPVKSIGFYQEAIFEGHFDFWDAPPYFRDFNNTMFRSYPQIGENESHSLI